MQTPQILDQRSGIRGRELLAKRRHLPLDAVMNDRRDSRIADPKTVQVGAVTIFAAAGGIVSMAMRAVLDKQCAAGQGRMNNDRH